ncbi:MAG: dynamin family protein [Deltaproteobacteria bacterium]|nr:dynamin family protein [Deltaproteobacteria bacterium]
MSPPTVLSPKLSEKFDSIRRILQAALSLAQKLGDAESAEILQDRLANLQSAALFVIVGEVKSGKSSFVNALLGEDICEVAPDPCTAGIQELVYGDDVKKTQLGDQWERVALPAGVLKEISIVDTPGTNSIIRRHETITENYIPRSDLVIFVFPAKNPHTGTAWELLDLVRKEWRRKTIFVLQQADLASQHELSTNLERVKQYAHERNIQNPVVFAVSAKREQEGASDSGFAEFREFLRKAVEGGDVWKMKVEGAQETVKKIAGQFLDALRREEASIAVDRGFYSDLISKVDARRDKANSLKRLVVDSLAATYNRLSSVLEEDITAGLGVGSILRRSIPLIRDNDFHTWIRDIQSQFEKRAKDEIDAESLRVSKDISDEMQTMLDDLVNAVYQRQKDKGEVSLSISSGRTDVLERLRAKLGDLRIADIVGDKGVQGSDLSSLTLAGGGIAAIGTVIAFATNIMVIDITGGVIAALGLGLVTLTLLWKRSGVLKELHQKLTQSRNEFRDRLEQEITQMFDRLFIELKHRLKEPLARLDEEAARLAPLAGEAADINEKAAGLDSP